MAELTDAQKVLRNDTGKRIAEALEALGGTPPINLGMTGATPGQVPVINTVDANGAPTSYRPGAGGGASMTILSYGNSTWADFIAAYNSNSIVYCCASSAADPSSGSQTRLAFMSYVNNASSPTSVEFQYYRSVSSHTDAQQGDQVFIYKLTSAGVWSVTVREAYTKIAAGSNMNSSYENGTLTLGVDMTAYRTAAAQDAIDAAQNSNLATIESSPATAAHAVGEYIVLNGQLYRVTAAITAGQTLTVGTNISAVSGGGLNDVMANFAVESANLTPNNDIVNINYAMSVLKSGNVKILSLVCHVNPISDAANFSILCYIPSGFLPTTKYEINAVTRGSKNNMTIQILANDNRVYIRPVTATTSADVISAQITYI